MSDPGLRRTLTLWPLMLYGLGVIVGAGIYVATGAVIARAGSVAPTAFLLAGITAGLTGLCYAELAGRFPEASGSVAYIGHGFGSRTAAQLAGAMLILAVTVSAASITRGAVQYLQAFIPLSTPPLAVLLIAGFAGVALLGVRESVGLAAAMSVIEIAGLLVAAAAGLRAAPSYHIGALVPLDLAAWRDAVDGAFIAFFAFLGFETLANLGEEARQPEHVLPRGILGTIAASMVLYVGVTAATVLAGGTGANPLLGLFSGRAAVAFAAVAIVAVANGVLVEIIMLTRLLYGMARNRQLPAVLGRVSARTEVPSHATLAAGSLVLATALAIPFEHLLVLTNTVTLAIFVAVDLALWRLHRTSPPLRQGFAAPRWVPPLAALSALALLLAGLLP